MEEFKKRLVTESTELDEKIEKLATFMGNEKFNQIDPIQQSLLKTQYNAMITYSVCLSERIAWLKD